MKFSSMNELKRYVEKANKKAMKEVAEKQKEILKDEVREQVYEAYMPQWTLKQWGDRWQGRTYRTLNNIDYILNGNSIVLKLRDTQSWYSVYNYDKKVYAFEMMEQGFTWGRPQTNIKEVVTDKYKREIADFYIEAMRNNGVKVKKK